MRAAPNRRILKRGVPFRPAQRADADGVLVQLGATPLNLRLGSEAEEVLQPAGTCQRPAVENGVKNLPFLLGRDGRLILRAHACWTPKRCPTL